MRSRTLIPGLSWRGDQVALAVTPVVFGPPGMVAGAVAAWKGARGGNGGGLGEHCGGVLVGWFTKAGPPRLPVSPPNERLQLIQEQLVMLLFRFVRAGFANIIALFEDVFGVSDQMVLTKVQ